MLRLGEFLSEPSGHTDPFREAIDEDKRKARRSLAASRRYIRTSVTRLGDSLPFGLLFEPKLGNYDRHWRFTFSRD